MAELRFNDARFEQFKGVKDASYALYDKTDVVGANGTGKSTLGLGLVLPFTGKDLSGRSNPEIHPDFMTESEPHITINAEIDGSPVEIEMIQKDTRTKKEVEANAPARIANKYRINSVDKSAKAFRSDLLERGIDLDKYEMLTNPNWFTALKETDKRSAVFAMADNITDADVVESLGAEAEDVGSLLGNYTLEEIESKAKLQKKSAVDAVERIPDQITGMEASKQEVDVPMLSAKKQRLEAAIALKEADFGKVQNISRGSISALIDEHNLQLRSLVSQANDTRNNNIRSAKSQLSVATDEVILLQRKIDSEESRISRKKNDLSYKTDQMNSQLAEYNKLKEETFPDGKTVCPTCGQKLPSKRIEQLKSIWEKQREENLSFMKEQGNNLAKEIKNLQKEISTAETALSKDKEILVQKTAVQEEKRKHLEIAEKSPAITVESLPEYPEIKSKISNLQSQLGDIDKIEEDRAKKLSELNGQRLELIAVEKELAKQQFNEDIDKKIAELNQNLRDASQNKADAEKILYQLDLINRKKNEMLSESVNSKFPENIRFKLFDTLKNGEVKNVCIPLIKNENGEWKEIGKTANNALELRAKLEILDTFQKFYGMRVPVIIDNAECLDADSKSKINMGCQLIFLTVKDNEKLTVTDIS